MAGEMESKVSVKLLIDTKANKVLFAEAGKEFVDFLFHIMSLPVGTVVKLLNVSGMVGCLGVLYKSIESLSSDYFQNDVSKESVLEPIVPVSVPLLSLIEANTPNEKILYRCRCYNGRNCNYYTDFLGTPSPSCNQQMCIPMSYAGPTAGSEVTSSSTRIGSGFVKGVVTYMVMDNLEVKPMSTISGITLISKFRIKDVSALEEKEVQVGLREGVAMLKASMETKSVLTSVFLG